MHRLINIVIIVGLALVGGGYSAWYAVQDHHGFGSIRIGLWTAWPLAGNVDADPYTEAHVAREGTVPLGQAEGIAFFAGQDEAGDILLRQCNYLVSGRTPSSRLWTLAAISPSQLPVPAIEGTPDGAFSSTVVRNAGGDFELAVGPRAAAGNWISTSGSGPFSLVMRLYDTPVTSSSGLVDPVMPTITKTGCLQ
ncbi:MAG: DUF1214 domain-containing protein [Pseudomonadota bacterium]